MHAAGVPLLAGTDTSSFGFALHRELEAFVAAGYLADLILLDANPLQDIVILRGKLLDRGALDEMLAKVKARYAAPRSE